MVRQQEQNQYALVNMCVLHCVKFFETFPVEPSSQARKLQVKPLQHRSPKNNIQVVG